MMSLEAIVAVNEELAAKAAREKRKPFVPNGPDDADSWPPFPFPNIGYYEPSGWEATDTNWFVDKTGSGREDEIALTIDRFRQELKRHIEHHPGDGFAITEEGPFQAVVSAMRRILESPSS